MAVDGDFVEEFVGICHSGCFEKYPELGVHWNRSDFKVWRVVDPNDAPFPQWDAAILRAKAKGVQTLMLLDANYTPEWASVSGKRRWLTHSPDLLMEALEAVVNRYTQPPFNVRFFEISNEPNLGEFWNGDGENQRYETFIDNILAPASEIVHHYGGKVVAPSITMEWPGYLGDRGVGQQQSNLGWVRQMVKDWLGYHDAWRHIDYFSFHYTKGDVEKRELPAGSNMMPLYDDLFEDWVKPGKIEGFWNTEEGLTAVHGGEQGFLSLKPWERPPYGQWVVRYTIPFMHWALSRGWRDCHQFKLFWYHIKGGSVLGPTSIVSEEEPHKLLPMGRALQVMTSLFRGARTVEAYEGDLDVGFGLRSENNRPYKCTHYAFRLDKRLLIVAWMELPGLETEGPAMEAVIRLERRGANWSEAVRFDYDTGTATPLVLEERDDGLWIQVPRQPQPVVYLQLN